MTEPGAATNNASDFRAKIFGVRARLLAAFFAISAFAILAAAAGIYSFREVGAHLNLVDTRIAPTLRSLELSRSAERIIAAAPALLAASDRNRRDRIKAELEAEAGRLNGTLLELKRDAAESLPLQTIEMIVSSLTASLAELEELVAARLDISERVRTLRRGVIETNDETQRLLAPWLEVLGGEIASLVERSQSTDPAPVAEAGRLTSLITLQRLTRVAQAQVSNVVDMLNQASTAEQTERLPVLAFQLGLTLRDLEATATGLDSRLQPLFLTQVGKLRAFVEGPNAIADSRRRELALVGKGETLLRETGRLSAQLSAAVDELGGAAKQDIGEAIRGALSVQQLSSRTLIVLVALSLLSSVLIVWLYVGGNIVRRLTALSDGMLAIAGGRLHEPVAAQGGDEIAAMGRAVEVFRRNAIELEQLLEERKETASRLEQIVEQRTRELSESLDRQTATSEVLSVISRSPGELEAVFQTILANATRICGAKVGILFRYEDGAFVAVSKLGITPAYAAFLDKGPIAPGRGTGLRHIVDTKQTIHIVDALAEQAYREREPLRVATAELLGARSMLNVPMLKDDELIGAIGVYRSEVRPFTEKQVELVTSFANQAVIAIENARLFDEIQDKSRQLEVANKYKSHFLASASHDLRQPLHALNLFVAQLRAESDPAERERLVARVDAAVRSMNELFGALLDMSKLEAGILETHITEFPIERVLQRIETTFANAAREKGLRLKVAPSSAWVLSDFILLERILLNLVSNAVRYTARGGVVVGCRRRGGQLRIDVCDSGPGIPEEQQANVFREFYQLEAAAPEREGGVGLGLAIVERLGRLLDHAVELESRLGRGARFSVSLPMASEARRAGEAPEVSPAIADPVRGKRVLVIDDDALVLEGMGGMLRGWGCEVMTAESAEAALAQAALERPPDLIISDYRLARGKTGIEAIERLRAVLGAPVPAFLISGDTAPERLRDARASGYHLLHKPVAHMRLRAMVNQLLRTSAPLEIASAAK